VKDKALRVMGMNQRRSDRHTAGASPHGAVAHATEGLVCKVAVGWNSAPVVKVSIFGNIRMPRATRNSYFGNILDFEIECWPTARGSLSKLKKEAATEPEFRLSNGWGGRLMGKSV
jgi:hypothetical protein